MRYIVVAVGVLFATPAAAQGSLEMGLFNAAFNVVEKCADSVGKIVKEKGWKEQAAYLAAFGQVCTQYNNQALSTARNVGREDEMKARIVAMMKAVVLDVTGKPLDLGR